MTSSTFTQNDVKKIIIIKNFCAFSNYQAAVRDIFIFFVNFILLGVGHSSCIGHTTPPPHMDSKCDQRKHLTLVNIELEITQRSLESGLLSPEAEEYASNFAAFRVKTRCITEKLAAMFF